MSFQVIWSEHSENQLSIIFEYYSQNTNVRVAKKLIRALITEPKRLKYITEIGQREDLLLNREIEYRYLIYKNYKIIYSVDFNLKLIKVADVFDTRQNPEGIKRTK
jgi:plasmid stabilization system protein ParE